MTRHDLVIGIDGGGTNTRAWLAECKSPHETNVIGRGNSGAGNPRTEGIDVALRHLDEAVQAAFRDANLQRRPVKAACIGSAGADRKVEQAAVHRWAERTELATHTTITNDALPILYAGDSQGIGVALIAGTGSIAFGRNSDGNTARCGGWGPIMGDEGSGYAIACQGLRAAARSSDGRGPRTELLERFLARFEITTASELIPAVYSDHFDRGQVAKLASIVFDSDANGDPVATEILDQATGELAIATESVVRSLCLPRDDFVLGLSGGLLVNRPRLRDGLGTKLLSLDCPPREIIVIDEPVAGAVIIAASYRA